MPKIVDHQQRRDEITAVSALLISERGIEAVTFRELAKASGYSKGIIEHYFENKSDLVSASLDWANQRYYERANSAVKGKTGLAAIEARLLSTLPVNEAIRMEWKIRMLFWAMACVDPALNKEQQSRFSKTTSHFMAELKVAVNNGEIVTNKELNLMAQRLLFKISGLSCAAVHNPKHYHLRRMKKEIRHMVAELKNN